MRILSIVLTIATVLASAAGLKAEDRQLAEAARKVLKANENAMVGVNCIAKLQLKAGGQSQDREIKLEFTSLVIDASGLSVTSLTNLNPQTVLQRTVRAGRRGGDGATADVTIECELSGIKMRLPDGTEVPARVLLKDEDSDLAFLGPSEALSGENKKKIAVTSLDSAKPAELLDSVIELGLTGKDFNYAPAVQVGHVAAVLSKPRTCYLGATSGLGTPVFSEQGKLTGLVTRLVVAGKESEGDVLSAAVRGAQAGGISKIILPTAEISKLVDQAKEAAKKPAPKEE